MKQRAQARAAALARVAVLVAAAAVVVVVWRWRPGATKQPADILEPRPHDEVRPLVAPASPAVSSEQSTERDMVPTKVVDRRFTPEQQARLEEIGREFGELESRRIEAERQWTLARAEAAGTPAVAPLVAELRAAREALEQRLRELPGRMEAEQQSRAAQTRAAEAAARLAGLKQHVEEHLARADAGPQEGCEWCARDRARMAVAEARTDLAREMMKELAETGRAAREAEMASRTARQRLAQLMRSARTNEQLRTYYERLRAAAQALEAAMAAVPGVARWREDAQAALARQRELMDEWREIHRSAPLVDPATGETVQTRQMAAAADAPERVRTTP
ncbi:MAG: hypothetical protein N2652_05760 [Kiritimatiellae bacterium]|nr:hypothetical protein [Kiritimatiellia bacterium]